MSSKASHANVNTLIASYINKRFQLYLTPLCESNRKTILLRRKKTRKLKGAEREVLPHAWLNKLFIVLFKCQFLMKENFDGIFIFHYSDAFLRMRKFDELMRNLMKSWLECQAFIFKTPGRFCFKAWTDSSLITKSRLNEKLLLLIRERLFFLLRLEYRLLANIQRRVFHDQQKFNRRKIFLPSQRWN